jgi:microcystin-dependent protein
MGEPFIGEIRMFGASFAPAGWAFCNGATIPISENDALFTLIGTTYGGDGQETFQLPDLQGRLPMHQGTGKDGVTYTLGEKAGVESVTLTTQQIPIHTHPLTGNTANGTEPSPAGALLATSTSLQPYAQVSPSDASFSANSITPVGGSQPHENLQPYLCISFIISLFGVFPSQS